MAATAYADSFLEEFSPLSEALIATTGTNQRATTAISSVFITIGTEKCFKHFLLDFLMDLATLEYRLLLMKFVEWQHFAMFIR